MRSRDVGKDAKQRQCPFSVAVYPISPESGTIKQLLITLTGSVGQECGQGTVGTSGVSAERQRLDRLKAHVYTRLVVDAGCRLAFWLRPSAGGCTWGLSVWPETLASMMALFQG